MADVTVKIDADTAAYIAKIAKMAEAQEKVTAATTKSGQGMEAIAGGALKAVASFYTLREIVGAFDSALGKAQAKLQEMSVNSGKLANSLAPSLASLGFSQREQDSALIPKIKRAEGLASTEQLTGIVQRLGAINDERAARGFPLITKQQAGEFIDSARQYGEAGLGKDFNLLFQRAESGRYGFGIGRSFGRDANEIAGSRSVSTQYIREQVLEDSIRDKNYTTEQIRDPTGFYGAQARERQAAYNANSDRSPFWYALSDGLRSAADKVGLRNTVESLQRNSSGSTSTARDIGKDAVDILKRNTLRPDSQHTE